MRAARIPCGRQEMQVLAEESWAAVNNQRPENDEDKRGGGHRGYKGITLHGGFCFGRAGAS